MKPTYEVRAWREDDWWLVRVVGAGDGADPAPLNALTQARTVAHVEAMARDLVATILDAEEGAFDITVDYALSDGVGEVVHQARAARAWAEEARELWQDRSVAAARALAKKGYSLRETAALLGLSHQRVDQLLNASPVMERAFAGSLADYLARSGAVPPHEADVIVVLSRSAGGTGERAYVEQMDPQFKEEMDAALSAWQSRVPSRESRVASRGRGQETRDEEATEASLPAQPRGGVIGRGWAIVRV